MFETIEPDRFYLDNHFRGYRISVLVPFFV